MARLTQIGTTNVTYTSVKLYSNFMNSLIRYIGDIVETCGVEGFMIAVGSNFVRRCEISPQKGVKNGSSQAHDFVKQRRDLKLARQVLIHCENPI